MGDSGRLPFGGAGFVLGPLSNEAKGRHYFLGTEIVMFR